MIGWWSSTRDRKRRILSLLSRIRSFPILVARSVLLNRRPMWFSWVCGRCKLCLFAALSFGPLFRLRIVFRYPGDSLSCIGDTPFTHSDICSCKLVEVTGTHFPSLGFWSSFLMSRIAVKRLLFFSRSELASCFKMVWWESNSCNLSWRSLFSFCSDMTSSFA